MWLTRNSAPVRAIRAAIGCLALIVVALDAIASEDISAAVSEFKNLINTKGSVTFRSWSGKSLYPHNDTELTFFPNNAVHMFEYGYALGSYHGKYEVQPTGQISIRFVGYHHAWPDMVLGRDSISLLLQPADSNVDFVMGNRGSRTVPPVRGYWPFRMLTGDDEKDVLKMIRERAEGPAT